MSRQKNLKSTMKVHGKLKEKKRAIYKLQK
jgi:hypothetical protein